MHCILLKSPILRLMALALAILLLAMGLAPMVRAAEPSGTDGNISWNISGGVLTISGSGDMPAYEEHTPAPWHDYADAVRSIRVENGVTSLGAFAFFCLDRVCAVTLADSVTRIGSYAFYGCSAMEMIDLGSGVQEIGDSAFAECTALGSIRLPQSLQILRFHAFYRCESLISITVPASVTVMESTVFGYCTSLQNAVVLANIQELPLWTFYGCYELRSVSLTPAINSVGMQAFENCEKLPENQYDLADGSQTQQEISSSSTVQENDTTITTDSRYTSNDQSAIHVQTTSTQSDSGTEVQVQVDAVVENASGWQDVQKEVDSAAGTGETVQVNVGLMGDTTVSGEDLSRFAQKDVELSIRTPQGALWHVDGQNIRGEDLSESYDLSFDLHASTDLTEEQKITVGIDTSYVVEFNADLDFKVEVELPLGTEFAQHQAVFFAHNGQEYERMQATVVDSNGVAHFYLQKVDKDTEYLIGLDVKTGISDANVSDAIVPDTMQQNDQKYEQMEQIEYVVVGMKSSWDMDLGQVTTILAVVMVSCVIVVGVVMYIMFKRKLKKGYVPDMRYEDEVESD